MRVLITGGSGFLGQKLAKALLTRGYVENNGQKQEISKIIILDQRKPALKDDRLEFVTTDISNAQGLAKLILPQTDLIFHLAAVVSGEAEQHFDVGMFINLVATQKLLEICRKLAKPPKLIFASSVAVFGGDMPDIIQDNTAATPQSSYGSQKAICELLMNDYSRKGFIDARVLRYPTIVVRPGKPNAATSTFASSIIREPLQSQDAICPVKPDTKLWILSPRQAIASTLKATDMPAEQLGEHRTLSLPGLSVSVQDMLNSLENTAGKTAMKRINWQHDPFIQNIVGSWPSQFAPQRAANLGFKADASMDAIIQNFIEDDLA